MLLQVADMLLCMLSMLCVWHLVLLLLKVPQVCCASAAQASTAATWIWREMGVVSRHIYHMVCAGVIVLLRWCAAFRSCWGDLWAGLSAVEA
jgi:hypothetical protein